MKDPVMTNQITGTSLYIINLCIVSVYYFSLNFFSETYFNFFMSNLSTNFLQYFPPNIVFVLTFYFHSNILHIDISSDTNIFSRLSYIIQHQSFIF